jgi:hypothetical protein
MSKAEAAAKTGQGDEDGPDEEEEEVTSPQERLKRLYERKENLMSNLQDIDESLAKLGYNVDSVKTKELKKDLQTGIRIDGKLSFRGIAMAAEYFKRVDEDNDGFLGWEDFRAMRCVGADFIPALGGFVHDAEYVCYILLHCHCVCYFVAILFASLHCLFCIDDLLCCAMQCYAVLRAVRRALMIQVWLAITSPTSRDEIFFGCI